MNVSALINTIVKQTTVLVAELATSGGLRAPLAHVADQVFLELARELETQGLSRKVSADMFGMALRSYQRKVQRLEEGETDRGRTLWESVYDFIRSREVVTRRQVLERFACDEEALIRGVLTDLVESGLVFAAGPSQETTFRAASDGELHAMRNAHEADADEMVWALVFRVGPATLSSLASTGRFRVEALGRSLDRLMTAGRISRDDPAPGEEAVYRTTRFVVPLGAETGWEAAVFDHYHAVVRTICDKLRQTAARSSIDDRTGGSTYSFEVWSGHPLEDEVLGTLRRFRETASNLRARVRDYNREHAKPASRTGVLVYGGQTFWELENDEQTA